MVPGGGRAQPREKERARGRQLGTGWDRMDRIPRSCPQGKQSRRLCSASPAVSHCSS